MYAMKRYHYALRQFKKLYSCGYPYRFATLARFWYNRMDSQGKAMAGKRAEYRFYAANLVANLQNY